MDTHPFTGCCVIQDAYGWRVVCCACRREVAHLTTEDEAHEARRLHGDVCPARELAEPHEPSPALPGGGRHGRP